MMQHYPNAKQEAISRNNIVWSFFPAIDPPRGRPVGGGGVHRNGKGEQIFM